MCGGKSDTNVWCLAALERGVLEARGLLITAGGEHAHRRPAAEVTQVVLHERGDAQRGACPVAVAHAHSDTRTSGKEL